MIGRRSFIKGLVSGVASLFVPRLPVTEKKQRIKVICDKSQIANFVSVSFDGIEYSEGFWFRDGKTYYTMPIYDKESIRKYGMKIKLVYGGPLTLEEANRLRDLYLEDYSRPFYSVSIERQHNDLLDD